VLFAIFVYVSVHVISKIDTTTTLPRSYSIFLFLISSVTDDSTETPVVSRKNLKTRLIIGPWVLASVVIVNGYIQILIGSLTTPFGLSSVSSFTDLTTMLFSEKEIKDNSDWAQAAMRISNILLPQPLVARDIILVNSMKHKKVPERKISEKDEFHILSSFNRNTNHPNQYDNEPIEKWFVM